ncbi:uncharacterized protein LOC107467586 isoform X1 [Arachis duranensis]|uniref:Uncharacterized protein LOC107467586 isoform X1 n=1 Tax=Arachis duranensis TaxID=130453 RepID=A0A6P5MQC2_ARADU|nr:uncharacterized protein LOC107467586 isoform X1 [Arachis duranensis]XP_025620769.1 uncharacterized protein LOC112712171 isoform X1 [Arachis hypogaea]
MNQQLLRPLRSLPWLHHHHPRTAATATLLPLQHHHLLSSKQPPTKSSSSSHIASAQRNLNTRSRGLLRTNVPLPSPSTTADFDSELKKSRNQLKREAKRAVQWAMDLASLSPPQIKRILGVASLDQVVFEALMLVKRLGPDVREGKRRQFNYIGKLLRDVEPDLMDRLIKVTKDSDQKELQVLTGLGADDLEDDDDLIEIESEEDEKESNSYDNQVTKWFDGLIDKDIQITNEVYSVQGVEFDRQQELRKLVRRVHSTQEMKAADDEEEKKKEMASTRAKKALTRFLRGLARSLINDY